MVYKKPSTTQQNRLLREKLRLTQKKLQEAEELIERICQTVGYDKLSNSWDQTKYPYGWLNSWLSPIYTFIHSRMGTQITANFRNELVAIVQAVIMQLAILGRYGISIPHEPRSLDVEASEAKKKSQFFKNYPPCVICQEDRITDVCHIIPRAHGGPDHSDNYFIMCPLHHHLFDQARFTKEEWNKVELALTGKMESAIIYAKNIRYKSMQFFWGEI